MMWMWANSPRNIDQDSLDQIVHDCKLLGVTDILFLAYDEYGGSGLLCDSALFNVSTKRIAGKRTLDYLTDAAHAAGMRVHLWWLVACWGGMYNYLKTKMPSSWNCRNSIGASDWLDMSQPAVRSFLAQAGGDLVTSNPAIDGLHLDYIRYETGMPRQYAQISANDVTATVTSIHGAVGEKTLTAAGVPYRDGYPGYNFDVAGCGQNWPGWLRAGLVDAVQVMNYYDAANLDAQLAQYTELTDIAAGKIADGISPMDWAEPMSDANWSALLATHKKYDIDLAVFDHAQMATARKTLLTGDAGILTFSAIGLRSGVIVADGHEVQIGDGESAIRRAVEGGVGRFAANLFIHRNRDGSFAIATGRIPLVWPEDM